MIAPILIALAAIAGCGGGSGGTAPTPAPGACTASNCGTLLVGLTDADGDFLSYSVDVVSLSLETANGRQVETLPVRQRVDFAEFVDSSELITALLRA